MGCCPSVVNYFENGNTLKKNTISIGCCGSVVSVILPLTMKCTVLRGGMAVWHRSLSRRAGKSA